MSYSPTTLRRIAGGLGGSGPSIWHYTTTDAHGAVDATDYFSNGKDAGMHVADVVFVVDTSGGTATMHYVSAIDSDGNATIAAATLA
jgi:Mg-chelatase subunit ChlD